VKLSASKRSRAQAIYLLLSALFVSSLVTCNLIANKFVEVDLGFKTFVISVGVLPYPITFLITDFLSEIYGQRRTTHVVYAGFFASLFVLFMLWLGNQFPSIATSPVSDEVYAQVFQNSWRVILSSMLAYLTAQLVDVRLFHFWKGLTGGKMLWVRNNFSTILSQLVDTSLVVFVLFVGTLDGATMMDYIRDGWLFKLGVAIFDTLFIYLAVGWMRVYFSLEPGEEVDLD